PHPGRPYDSWLGAAWRARLVRAAVDRGAHLKHMGARDVPTRVGARAAGRRHDRRVRRVRLPAGRRCTRLARRGSVHVTVRPPLFAGRDDASTAAAVEELVSEMIRVGVGPGELVALSGANGPDWVVSFAALTRGGAAVLPLPHDSPAAELDRLTVAAR